MRDIFGTEYTQGTDRTLTLKLNKPVLESATVTVKCESSGEQVSTPTVYVNGTSSTKNFESGGSITVTLFKTKFEIILSNLSVSGEYHIYVDYDADERVFGIKSDKSLVETITKAQLAGGGRFVTVQGQTNISLGQVKEVDVTLAQCQEWFGTTDTSKIHVVATDMYRVCSEKVSGYYIKSWSNAYYLNTDAGNVTYTIPYIDFYDINDYPWPEDRIASIFLYNHNQIDIHEQVTYRIFAFVED